MRSMPRLTSASACFFPTTADKRLAISARRFDGVANVLAVAQRRFPKQPPVRAAHFDAVTRIRPRLFAADIEFHGAVDRGSRGIGWFLGRLIHRERRRMYRWRVLKPCRLEIFEKPLAPTLASIT